MGVAGDSGWRSRSAVVFMYVMILMAVTRMVKVLIHGNFLS